MGIFEITSFNPKVFSTDSTTDIQRLHSGNLNYDDFFNSFMLPNRPCIIQGVTKTWDAAAKWVLNDGPNLGYLGAQYGSSEVTVYDCNERYYNSQKTETVRLGAYLERWKTGDLQWAMKYLKDWHLQNEAGSDDGFYEVPIYFASDWLNEFLVANGEDDYRFVYMGRAGTWTPFHADVFGSFSWSANVCGKKRWILFPPGEERHLADSLRNLPYDVSSTSVATSYTKLNHIELVQEAGEAIFVPSGWYHQVWNLEDTISVNHNWINGCNVGGTWTALADALEAVKREIEDCAEMDGFLRHCQVVLKAAHGMDFAKFFDFLRFILRRRMVGFGREEEALFHGHAVGSNHALFDLRAARNVLGQMLNHGDFESVGIESDEDPEQLLGEVDEFLVKYS